MIKINTMLTFCYMYYQNDEYVSHFDKNITKINLHSKKVSVTFTPCKRDNNPTSILKLSSHNLGL